MEILIAGGAGFIGSNLTEFHLNRKDEVTIIDNLITGNNKNIESFVNKNLVKFIKADIVDYDYDELPTFDIVYHLASPASPIQYKKYPQETLITNSFGTKKLLDFFVKSHSGSFVISSTSEVYGDPLVHPQPETYWGNVNPVGIRSCYDEAKRFAEALVMVYFRKYKINLRVARIFNTYGPNMEKNDGRVVSNFIIQALSNHPITIYGDGNQTRSFCYVSDMVKGLYGLASRKNLAGEIINLGNPVEKSIKEMATLIKELTGSDSPIVFEKIDQDDPKKRKPDINKAQKKLGWNPEIPLTEGLKKTISYFKERFL
ncbi:SDR family oxidoreductase [Candidatus Roizmanbacteria bacterium]|jgi:nucleoside-diphosphate-sugar epimerase|nr:SDR family oxidoreductase [Candidatus Roizmanbacteria bacterium]